VMILRVGCLPFLSSLGYVTKPMKFDYVTISSVILMLSSTMGLLLNTKIC
jgi:hypothetical protein